MDVISKVFWIGYGVGFAMAVVIIFVIRVIF